MKAVAAALGLARSHLHDLLHRCADWVDGRTCRTPKGDAELVAEIREQVAELPSYGYRRACALVPTASAARQAGRGSITSARIE